MIDEVYEAFLEEYKIQSCLGFNNNEINGFSGFIFSKGERNVYTPESINRALHRNSEAYNKQETIKATEGKRVSSADSSQLLSTQPKAHLLYETM